MCHMRALARNKQQLVQGSLDVASGTRSQQGGRRHVPSGISKRIACKVFDRSRRHVSESTEAHATQVRGQCKSEWRSPTGAPRQPQGTKRRVRSSDQPPPRMLACSRTRSRGSAWWSIQEVSQPAKHGVRRNTKRGRPADSAQSPLCAAAVSVLTRPTTWPTQNTFAPCTLTTLTRALVTPRPCLPVGTPPLAPPADIFASHASRPSPPSPGSPGGRRPTTTSAGPAPPPRL